MLKALSDSHSEVRQAAAYGCGIMGLKGGPAYALHCARALEPLAALVSKPNARDTKENMAATENAISAVSKILKYNCSALDPNNVFLFIFYFYNHFRLFQHLYLGFQYGMM